MSDLNELQIIALQILARSRRLMVASEVCLDGANTARMTGLVRRGLVESVQQSEQVRGERRVYYRLYRISPAGIEALRSLGRLPRDAARRTD